MTLLSAIPALPVSDMAASVTFYTERLGFAARHVEDDFAIMARDQVEVHLWAANKPDTAGAEPHLAGTASCRIRVTEIEELFHDLQRQDVVHPNSGLRRQWWGDEDFTVKDADNNAITFFQPSE